MHPRSFGSERIVCTYYDVQKSVLHVHIRLTYNQPRVTSGYERFAWVFGTFDKITPVSYTHLTLPTIYSV